MFRNLISALMFTATPLPASSEAVEARAMTYDEALHCSFVTMAYGLRLNDSEDETVKERATTLIELIERFLLHARQLSGHDERKVIDDMGALGSGIVESLQASEQPVAAMRQMASDCEETARTEL